MARIFSHRASIVTTKQLLDEYNSEPLSRVRESSVVERLKFNSGEESSPKKIIESARLALKVRHCLLSFSSLIDDFRLVDDFRLDGLRGAQQLNSTGLHSRRGRVQVIILFPLDASPRRART